MAASIDAQWCPHDEETRAERCETCCEGSALPPCAQNWLRARLSGGGVTALRRTPAREERKAA